MKFLRRQLTEKLSFGEFLVNVEVREVEGIGGSLILSISSQELKWMKLRTLSTTSSLDSVL